MKPSLFATALALGFATVACGRTPSPKDKQPVEAFPSFETVTAAVKEHFASRRGYKPGDLITLSAVEPLFGKLEKLNWKVADRRDILKLVMPDGDWLARQFRGSKGKDFMREIGGMPGGYDKVDRFRKMPYGQRRITDMIQSPDGYKMFEYITTTPYGKNLSKMMTKQVNGEDFNKPTGKLYTEADLLKRLKRSYDAAAAARISIEPSPVPPVPEAPAGKGAAGDGAAPAAPKTPAPAPINDPFEQPPHG